jgi:hypothetical protein
MTTTYAMNKAHIYKWRESNGDKVREVNRRAKAKFDNWKKIQKLYLNILLEII